MTPIETPPTHEAPAALTGADRARIVGLCARLTGDLDAAEDLAQEALFEAWRHEHELRDPAKRPQWLSGIARNVCRRWARGRGRELAHLAPANEADTPSPTAVEELVDASIDIEAELERGELAELLDRALGLVPPDTRDVLVARIVDDAPQRDVAERLGTSESTVAMRLLRGKLSLHRVLTTRMTSEAASYGLLDGVDGWRETRIWCPSCAERRLEGRWAERRIGLELRCPACSMSTSAFSHLDGEPVDFKDVRGFKPALNRVHRRSNELHRTAEVATQIPCPNRCGPVPIVVDPVEHRLSARCPRCGCGSDQYMVYLPLATPEGGRFWREHPRVRFLPPTELESGGRDAFLVTMESVSGTSRLHTVMARDNFGILAIHTG